MSDVHELPPHPRQRKGHRTLSPLLLASAKTESERQLYRSRIEREQRPLDQLRGGLPDRFAA
ncbi:hypothetical protein ABIF65_005736 [Bradyrhizobium japonicum]|jgi:hypothetical protein|nr:hypothetical protein [Bradyrhizobium japonicum]MCP1782359.1 hypothetical protein [Bradyrhizobium japonicum]MCP1861786.1 hypothetical protein [Bradyrhizobium japonicum]MCP1892544.1 hypothetical protein [Bradyrhizobium japonicum]MCP1965351.1 hypothetical protein [Bradyrhizobium japonicum]